ncbi:hypothetical protein DFH29DRAFT_894523 [Suillus ampliporus]|nr:hypothetical protein DFH29DRAFT_894523 [Suillus ampliporus]
MQYYAFAYLSLLYSQLLLGLSRIFALSYGTLGTETSSRLPQFDIRALPARKTVPVALVDSQWQLLLDPSWSETRRCCHIRCIKFSWHPSVDAASLAFLTVPVPKSCSDVMLPRFASNEMDETTCSLHMSDFGCQDWVIYTRLLGMG